MNEKALNIESTKQCHSKIISLTKKRSKKQSSGQSISPFTTINMYKSQKKGEDKRMQQNFHILIEIRTTTRTLFIFCPENLDKHR